MRKRILFLTMVSILAMSLVACGSSENKKDEDKNEKTTQSDVEKNESDEESKDETKKDTSKMDIDIKDEEYEHNIEYICEDGIDNGTFSFLLSQPRDEDLRIGSYAFKDIDNYNPIESGSYGFFNYETEAESDRKVSYRGSYGSCKESTIYDDIWNSEESHNNYVEVAYHGYVNDSSLDTAYVEGHKDENTVEIYQEGNYFVHARVSSASEMYYEVYYEIPDVCLMEITIHTDESEINKNLVKEITDNLSFEYVGSDNGAKVEGKSFAEDKLAQLLEKDFSIYLKNPINIKEMEPSEIIYEYEEYEYTLLFDSDVELKSSYQLITEYEDYDVYFDEGDYVFVSKSGEFLIKIWSSNLGDLDASEGYDLVRKVFLK